MYLYIHLSQLIRMHAYRVEYSIEGLESSIIKVILRLSGVNVRSDLAFLLLFSFVPHGIYRTAHTFTQTFIESPTPLLSSTSTKRQVSKDKYHNLAGLKRLSTSGTRLQPLIKSHGRQQLYVFCPRNKSKPIYDTIFLGELRFLCGSDLYLS